MVADPVDPVILVQGSDAPLARWGSMLLQWIGRFRSRWLTM